MLFNDRAAWEGVAEFAGEFVEHVPDANVEGFTEHAVAAIQSGDDLGVPARNVQQNGIITVAFPTSDFDVGHAVIDADEWNIMRGRKRSGNPAPTCRQGPMPGPCENATPLRFERSRA